MEKVCNASDEAGSKVLHLCMPGAAANLFLLVVRQKVNDWIFCMDLWEVLSEVFSLAPLTKIPWMTGILV